MALEILDATLVIVAALLSVPLLTLSLECLVALWPVRRTTPPPAVSGRVDVLIPAHDESLGIAATLASINSQLQPGDRVWVVADNCTDDTARVARAHDAIVLERTDAKRRGKSFALEFGLRHLAADPPAVLVLIDADCRLEPGALRELTAAAIATGQPVQAGYLMHAPRDPSPRDVISQCAVTLKNLVRPLGLHKLGFACTLTGSGMAFPWPVISGREVANGSIVEDMQLGIDLLVSGYRPMFCPAARVTAMLPAQSTAAASQRKRWEHGHLHVILTQVPRLLLAAVRRGRLDLLVAALDTAIPPLSLLVFLEATALAASLAVGAVRGLWTPAIVLAASGCLACAAVLIAWRRFAPREARWTTLLAAPHYMAGKLPLYMSFLGRRQKAWVRTAREPSPGGDSLG